MRQDSCTSSADDDGNDDDDAAAPDGKGMCHQLLIE